jgi:hypothetical protein
MLANMPTLGFGTELNISNNFGIMLTHMPNPNIQNELDFSDDPSAMLGKIPTFGFENEMDIPSNFNTVPDFPDFVSDGFADLFPYNYDNGDMAIPAVLPNIINNGITGTNNHRHSPAEKAFICTDLHCTRVFSRKQDLLRHELSVHQKDGSYKCQIAGCDRGFRGFPRKDKRDSHEWKIHGLRRL